MGLQLKKPFYWVYGEEYTLGFYSTLIKAKDAAQRNLKHEVGSYDKVNFNQITDTFWSDGVNRYWITKITELNVEQY